MHAGDRLFLAGLLVVTGAISAFVVLGRPDAVYSISAAKAVQQFDRYAGRQLRLQGALVPGSLKQRVGRCGFDFELMSDDQLAHRVSVHLDACVLPDTVCDLPTDPGSIYEWPAKVTVEGELERRGQRVHIQATELMSRCTAKYWSPDVRRSAVDAICSHYEPSYYCPICAPPGRYARAKLQSW